MTWRCKRPSSCRMQKAKHTFPPVPVGAHMGSFWIIHPFSWTQFLFDPSQHNIDLLSHAYLVPGGPPPAPDHYAGGEEDDDDDDDATLPIF